MTTDRKLVSRDERQMYLAHARAWRIANKPYFDAIYGPEDAPRRCPECGRAVS